MKKVVFALLIVCLMFSGCQCKKDDRVIKIGAILPLTGYAATNGEMSKNALILAVDSLNKLQSKYHFEIIYEDSKSLPKDAAVCYNKLHMQGTKFMIGFGGATLYSFIPQTNNRNEIIFATAAPNSDLLSHSNRCLRVYPDVAMVTNSLLEFTRNNNFKRVAIVYIQNEVYSQYAKSFKNLLKENNIELVFYEGYDPTIIDFKHIINKLSNSNADCIYLASTGSSTGIIIKQIYQNPNISKNVPIIGDISLANSENIKLIGELKSPVYIVNSQISHDFIDLYYKHYDETPNAFAAYSYSIPFMIHDVLCSMKDTISDMSDIYNQFIQSSFETVVGPITFDKNTHEPKLELSVYPL